VALGDTYAQLIAKLGRAPVDTSSIDVPTVPFGRRDQPCGDDQPQFYLVIVSRVTRPRRIFSRILLVLAVHLNGWGFSLWAAR